MTGGPHPLPPGFGSGVARPGLFDRLSDRDSAGEGASRDVRDRARGRQIDFIVRDLETLLNTVRPIEVGTFSGCSAAEGSVIDFGLPPLAGRDASSLDLRRVESLIRHAIVRFEPRIAGRSVEVRTASETPEVGSHNLVTVEIRGSVLSSTAGDPVLLRTELDLETGHIRLLDVARGR